MTINICLHGAESTGKSTLSPLLVDRFGASFVPEYGRLYCEEHGVDLTPADLLVIFEGHVALTDAAKAESPRWLISDTDPLMTQAWSVMLFDERLPQIDAWDDVADFYLVPALDLPWQEDGTRLFGTAAERQRFMDVAIAELDRRGLRWAWVNGLGDARLDSALKALKDAGFQPE